MYLFILLTLEEEIDIFEVKFQQCDDVMCRAMYEAIHKTGSEQDTTMDIGNS